jgi:bifunctional non-homologous end joining protein LigD
MLWRISPTRRRRTPPAGFISPAHPTLVAKPPSGPAWLHEVKHDGYRILARKQGSA